MFDIRKNKKLGTFLFWLLWPLVWFYAPLNIRIRAIVLFENKVLVVKNWFGPNTWQLPGGGRKTGEPVKETAYREIYEELGFKLDINKIVDLTDDFVVVRRFGIMYRYKYVVVNLSKKPKIDISSEISEFDWSEDLDSLIPAEVSLPS